MWVHIQQQCIIMQRRKSWKAPVEPNAYLMSLRKTCLTTKSVSRRNKSQLEKIKSNIFIVNYIDLLSINLNISKRL